MTKWRGPKECSEELKSLYFELMEKLKTISNKVTFDLVLYAKEGVLPCCLNDEITSEHSIRIDYGLKPEWFWHQEYVPFTISSDSHYVVDFLFSPGAFGVYDYRKRKFRFEHGHEIRFHVSNSYLRDYYPFHSAQKPILELDATFMKFLKQLYVEFVSHEDFDDAVKIVFKNYNYVVVAYRLKQGIDDCYGGFEYIKGRFFFPIASGLNVLDFRFCVMKQFLP